MRIEQLRYLVEIADTGTFTAAAQRLHVAQPSISQSLSALEAELGVLLLVRTRTGAEPTPVGAVVVEHARRVLEELDEIAIAAQRAQAEPSVVSVLASVIPIATILPPAVKAVKQRYENASINIREGSFQEAKQLLRKKQIDFAVIAYMDSEHNPVSEEFVFTPLFSSPLMALINKTSPLSGKKTLSLKEIQPYPIAVGTEEYVSSTYILERLAQYGPVNNPLRTRNVRIMLQNVEKDNLIGLRYGLLSLTEEISSQISVIPVDSANVTFGILACAKHKQTAVAKKLIQELHNAAENQVQNPYLL